MGVVASDADLARHVERDFHQQVAVGNAVDEWHDKVQAWRQHRVKAAQALDDPRMLLRNDFEGLGDKDDRNDEEDDCKREVHQFCSGEW